jgi:hypothetical protein
VHLPGSWRNVCEVVVVTAVCASLMFLIPYFNQGLCSPKKKFLPDKEEARELLPAAQFYCKPGPRALPLGRAVGQLLPAKALLTPLAGLDLTRAIVCENSLLYGCCRRER